nr:immunoglobulin light chain junction region [Macaca mulatta]
LHASSEFPWTF